MGRAVSSVAPTIILFCTSLLLLSFFAEAESLMERQALVDLYHSTNGPMDWLSRCRTSGWGTISMNSSVCTSSSSPSSANHGGFYSNLYGTVCDVADGSIIEINLINCGLTGTLPPSLSSSLPSLRHLYLTQNAISGALPEGAGVWSSTLERLYLSMNRFNGTLPDSWRLLHKMTHCLFSSNEITGTLPDSWGTGMPMIFYLSGDGNAIGGTLPRSWVAWRNMSFFYFQRNELEGSLPELWSGWGSTVYSFVMSRNRLSGSLPTAYANWTGLSSLSLSHNNFSGSIPEEFASMTELTYFEVNDNRLSGTLHNRWINFVKLQYFLVANNELVGTLPASWGARLPVLRYLWMEGNQLTGTVPGSWSALGSSTALESLNLGNNALQGTLPESWGAFSHLTELKLNDNQFTGPLPASWSGMVRLNYLDVNFNRLSGSLPSAWGGTLNQLVYLLARNNSFAGSLPAAWASMEALDTLWLDSNLLDGTLPSEWGAMPRLTSLNLSTNRLSGPIPLSWLLSSNSLQRLILDHNPFRSALPELPTSPTSATLYVISCSFCHLHGTLPLSWERLTSLSSLNLEGNQLVGTLPCWQGIDFLMLLNVRNNSLVGTLPPKWGSLLWICSDLQLSHNRLEGTIPDEWSRLEYMERLDLSDNRLTGPLPATWAMSYVTVMQLQQNAFYGTLPSQWATSFPSLTYLDVSFNQIEGSAPLVWGVAGGLPLLEVLRLQWNRLDGSLPWTWSSLTSLIELDLSRNAFTGSIPDAWFAEPSSSSSSSSSGSVVASEAPFASLQSLNVSFNALSGTLSRDWLYRTGGGGTAAQSVRAPFPKLRSLQLSHNHFEGPLPDEWWQNRGTLQDAALESLDLSFNHINGTLPAAAASAAATKFRLRSLRRVDFSSNLLSGTLQSSWSSLASLEMVDLANNSFHGSLPDVWSSWINIHHVDVSLNYLTGPLPIASWGTAWQRLSRDAPCDVQCEGREKDTARCSEAVDEDRLNVRHSALRCLAVIAWYNCLSVPSTPQPTSSLTLPPSSSSSAWRWTDASIGPQTQPLCMPRVPPLVPLLDSPTAVGVSVATVSVASLFLGAAGSLSAPMALMHRRLSSCDSDEQAEDTDVVLVDRASNPTQWCLRSADEKDTPPLCYVRGVIAGSYLYAVGFLVFGVICAAVKVFLCAVNNTTKRKKKPPPRSSSSNRSATLLRLLDAFKMLLTSVRYPGLWMCLANLFFLPAVAMATVVCFMHPKQQTIDVALGALGVLYCLLMLLSMLYATLPCMGMRRAEVIQERPAATTTNTTKSPRRRCAQSPTDVSTSHSTQKQSRRSEETNSIGGGSSFGMRIADLWLGVGYNWRNRRRNDSFVERWGYLFDSYRSREVAWFAAIECMTAVIVGSLTGASMLAGGGNDCSIWVGGSLGTSLLHVALYLYCMPQRAWLDRSQSMVGFAMSIGWGIAALSPHGLPASLWFADIQLWSSIALLGLTILPVLFTTAWRTVFVVRFLQGKFPLSSSSFTRGVLQSSASPIDDDVDGLEESDDERNAERRRRRRQIAALRRQRCCQEDLAALIASVGGRNSSGPRVVEAYHALTTIVQFICVHNSPFHHQMVNTEKTSFSLRKVR